MITAVTLFIQSERQTSIDPFIRYVRTPEVQCYALRLCQCLLVYVERG